MKCQAEWYARRICCQCDSVYKIGHCSQQLIRQKSFYSFTSRSNVLGFEGRKHSLFTDHFIDKFAV